MDYPQLVYRSLELPDAVTNTEQDYFGRSNREVVAALCVAKRGGVGLKGEVKRLANAGHAVIQCVIDALEMGELDFVLAGVDEYMPDRFQRTTVETVLVRRVDSTIADLEADEMTRMVSGLVDAVVDYVHKHPSAPVVIAAASE